MDTIKITSIELANAIEAAHNDDKQVILIDDAHCETVLLNALTPGSTGWAGWGVNTRGEINIETEDFVESEEPNGDK